MQLNILQRKDVFKSISNNVSLQKMKRSHLHSAESLNPITPVCLWLDLATLGSSLATRTAARTLLLFGTASSRIGAEARAAARLPFSASVKKPLSHRAFRCPSEMRFCVESMLPYHTATASALMTSMLSLSPQGYAFLPQGVDKTR